MHVYVKSRRNGHKRGPCECMQQRRAHCPTRGKHHQHRELCKIAFHMLCCMNQHAPRCHQINIVSSTTRLPSSISPFKQSFARHGSPRREAPMCPAAPGDLRQRPHSTTAAHPLPPTAHSSVRWRPPTAPSQSKHCQTACTQALLRAMPQSHLPNHLSHHQIAQDADSSSEWRQKEQDQGHLPYDTLPHVGLCETPHASETLAHTYLCSQQSWRNVTPTDVTIWQHAATAISRQSCAHRNFQQPSCLRSVALCRLLRAQRPPRNQTCALAWCLNNRAASAATHRLLELRSCATRWQPQYGVARATTPPLPCTAAEASSVQKAQSARCERARDGVTCAARGHHAAHWLLIRCAACGSAAGWWQQQ